MVKKILLIVIIATVTTSSFAQWTSSGSGEVYTTTSADKVGIGTSTPGDKLSVNGWIRAYAGTLHSGGFAGYDAMSGGNHLFSINRGHSSNHLSISSFDGIGFTGNATTGPSDAYQMFLKSNGYIGIGTNAPDQLLTLKGGGIGFDHNSSDKKLYSPSDGVLEWMTHNGAGTHGFAVSHQGTKAVFLNTSGASYFNGGYLGIGTDAPSSKLHVAGTFNAALLDDGNDRPGLGATGVYPQVVLMAGGSTNTNHGSTVMLGSYDSGTSGPAKHWSIGTAGLESVFLDFGFSQNSMNPHAGIRDYSGNTVMTLLNSGKVGIGTLYPTEKLSVNGTIRSKEIRVEASPWPDYVFKSDYKLPSLKDLDAYIKANQHLPELAPAKDMEANGVGLGEINIKLVKKIEELTLYIIEQNKALEVQNNKIADQQEQIDQIKKLLKAAPVK